MTHAGSAASWVPSRALDRVFTEASAEPAGPGRCFWWTDWGARQVERPAEQTHQAYGPVSNSQEKGRGLSTKGPGDRSRGEGERVGHG